MAAEYLSRSCRPKEFAMRTLHMRHHDAHYFHPHPLHGLFSLLASLALAGLIVIAFAIAAR